LAYIIGSTQLIKIITEPIGTHRIGFVAIWIFTFVFYAVFSYVREVVCTHICPYGRLQNVLLDSKTLVVAYDETRGEPRGKIHKDIVQNDKGDCIDCTLCVQVCPTGIDIREGTQLECVNCTACIDACDDVMIKIGKPTKLIGFYSNEFVTKRNPFKLGLRSYGYAVIIIFVTTIFASLIYKRENIQTTVLRASGTLSQSRADGTVTNLYNAELINKTNKDVKFVFSSSNPNDKIEYIRTDSVIAKEGAVHLTFFLVKKADEIKDLKTKVNFEVRVGGEVLSTAHTTFFAQPKGED
jgi:cytochrome c oxidase accessory protein FixG